MKFPVDDETLNAWAKLLGLAEEQTANTIKEIEKGLRIGYAHRPDSMRNFTFEELVETGSLDEMALLFLVTGLRQTGHDEAASLVEIRGIAAELSKYETD